MFDPGDILLYVLSAWRQTSWSTFRRSFDELHRRQFSSGQDAVVGDAALFRFRTLRMLMALGHVDTVFDPGSTGTIVIAPPALVALPGPGIKRAVLAGARSPAFLEKLRGTAQTAGVSFALKTQGLLTPFAPSLVTIQALDDESIKKVSQDLGVSYMGTPPARAIARWAGSLNEYIRGLVWAPDDNLGWYREDFAPDSLRFTHPIDRQTKMRLSRFQDPVRETWRYRLYRNGEFSPIDPDWGRYAVLASEGHQVFVFDGVSNSVQIPTRSPLPVILSRSLALCSGRSPAVGRLDESQAGARGLRHDIYEGIPPSVARLVASKIGQ